MICHTDHTLAYINNFSEIYSGMFLQFLPVKMPICYRVYHRRIKMHQACLSQHVVKNACALACRRINVRIH